MCDYSGVSPEFVLITKKKQYLKRENIRLKREINLQNNSFSDVIIELQDNVDSLKIENKRLEKNSYSTEMNLTHATKRLEMLIDDYKIENKRLHNIEVNKVKCKHDYKSIYEEDVFVHEKEIEVINKYSYEICRKYGKKINAKKEE